MVQREKLEHRETEFYPFWESVVTLSERREHDLNYSWAVSNLYVFGCWAYKNRALSYYVLPSEGSWTCHPKFPVPGGIISTNVTACWKTDVFDLSGTK